MPEATIEKPSLLNEPLTGTPADASPESKLYQPEPKGSEPKAPDAPKPDEPKPAGIPEPIQKKEEPKQGEPKVQPAGVPATPPDYESLKLPGGSLLSADELAAVKKEAKDNGLTLDEAQGVLEVKNDAVKAFSARQLEDFAKTKQEWRNAWLNDPEYGGDKATENTELAKRAWDKVADNELKTLANQTGFGDHPAVLRMMTRIGRMFAEDRLVRGSVGGAQNKKSPEEILYGGTTPGHEEPMT